MSKPENRTTVVIRASHQPWDDPEPTCTRAAWDCVSTDSSPEKTVIRVGPGKVIDVDIPEIDAILCFLHKPVGSVFVDGNIVTVSNSDGYCLTYMKPGEMSVIRNSGKLLASASKSTALLEVTVLPG